MVVDQEEEEEEVRKVRELAVKCLRRMRNREEVGGTATTGVKETVFSVREQRKVSFPVPALNSTRNQDLNDRSKPRTFGSNPPNLLIIE